MLAFCTRTTCFDRHLNVHMWRTKKKLLQHAPINYEGFLNLLFCSFSDLNRFISINSRIFLFDIYYYTWLQNGNEGNSKQFFTKIRMISPQLP
jgi:hypothetical protein